MAAPEVELILRLKDDTQKGFAEILSHLKQLQDEGKKTAKETSGMGKALADFGSGLAGGFGIGLGFLTAKGAADLFASSVKALPEFLSGAVSHLVQTGGHLTDVADKLGTNTEALQRLQAAGAPVSVSLESISGAATKMQKALVDTPEKFERLGLSAGKLRSMGLDDQLLAIGDRIRGIPDPAERATAAIELFGKSGAELLPLLNSNMRETMEQAQALGLILSKDVVAAADDLGDEIGLLSQTWEGFKNNIASVVVTSEPLHRLIQGLTQILGELSKSVAGNRDGLRSFVDSAVIVAAKGLVMLADASQMSIDVWSSLKLTVQSLANLYLQATLALEKFALATNKMAGNKEGIASHQAEVNKLQELIAKNSEAANQEVAANTRRTDAIQKLRAGLVALQKDIEASVGQTHKATVETHGNTAALGANAEQAARAKREADALWRFQIETARLATKTAQEYWERQEQIASAVGRRLAERLKEVNEREEERRAAARARAEAEQAELDANFDAARALAEQYIALGQEIGGAFGAILEFGGSAVLIMQNLDRQAETTAQKLAAAGNALNAATAAFKGGSVFGGALGGAAAGAAFGPLGAGIGALAGGLLGLFGGAEKARKELAKLKDQVTGSFGSMQAFAAAANRAGVDVSKAFSTKDPKEFERIVKQVNDAIEDQKKRLEGLKTAMGGLELMTKGFAAQMERTHMATEASQAAFTRLGNFAVATFAGLVRETGDVIGALQQMGPSLDSLTGAMNEFGFTASGAFARLLSLRDVVVANEDVATSISGLNQLIKGLGEAGAITRDLLLDMGAQARANFDELIARGVPANDAMALMQPTLQELWERQKRLGVVYDENTQKLIDQAKEQGLVGDQFLSTNEAMLEVLKILVETVGGTLPAALRRMGDEADAQFGRMRDAATDAGHATHGATPGGSYGGDGEPEGSYATGLPEVPRDMVAQIHRGEEIVASADRAARRSRMDGGSGGGWVAAPVMLDNEVLGQVLMRWNRAGRLTIQRDSLR